MANALYPKGKEKFLSGSINIPSDTIKAVLVSSAYTYSGSHEFLSDLGSNTLNTAQTLGTKAVTSGAFSAAAPTFPAVTSGATAQAVVLYKDTGVAGTSPLIAFIDTITGFPLATNGGDIAINWDTGTYKIFSL